MGLNIFRRAFIAWAYFIHQTVYDGFKHIRNTWAWTVSSIRAGNHPTWDRHPAGGILEFFRSHWRLDYRGSYRKVSTSPGTIPCGIRPNIPFAPDHKSASEKIFDILFSRVEVPRGHKDGYVTFPSGSDITIQAVATVKHVEQEESYPTPSPPMLAAQRQPSFLNFFRFPSPPSTGTKSGTTPAMVRFLTLSWCSMIHN